VQNVNETRLKDFHADLRLEILLTQPKPIVSGRNAICYRLYVVVFSGFWNAWIWPKAEVLAKQGNVRFGRRIQPVDATHSLNISAGV
jgi:hypothetical protein